MRVISLVPSATETLVALGVTPIACTRFCDLPGVPTIGGTKNPDIDAIVAFHPDLVVVNDEENRLEDADALRAAGCRLHSMSPRAVADVEPAINALAEALGVGAPPFEHWSTPSTRHTVFVATWRRPLMTLNANTYASSLLASIGYNNVFADASTRYPRGHARRRGRARTRHCVIARRAVSVSFQAHCRVQDSWRACVAR